MKFEQKLILSKQNLIFNKKNDFDISTYTYGDRHDFVLYSCGGYRNEILTIRCVAQASKHIPVHEVISLLCVQYQTM